MKTIDGINYYEQSDVDNITEKVKTNQQAKYEKTHIDLEKYKDLESKFNNVIFENKKSSLKEIFKAQGGNVSAFDDFIETNKEVLQLEGDNLNTKLGDLKKNKPFYFNNNTPTPNINFNDKGVVQELLGKDGTPRFVEGTIYKNKV